MTLFWLIVAVFGWLGAILLCVLLGFILVVLGGLQSEYQELEKKYTLLLEQKKSGSSMWALRKEVPFGD